MSTLAWIMLVVVVLIFFTTVYPTYVDKRHKDEIKRLKEEHGIKDPPHDPFDAGTYK